MRGIIRYAAVIAVLPALAIAHDAHAAAKHKGPIEIRVTEDGFVPARVEAPAGRPVTLVFLRTTDETCVREAVFPASKRRVTLPLNQPVRVTLRPRSNQPIEFACGMDMYRGQVVLR